MLYKFETRGNFLIVPDEMQRETIRKTNDKEDFVIAKTEVLVKQEFFILKLRKQVETVTFNYNKCTLYNKNRDKNRRFSETHT